MKTAKEWADEIRKYNSPIHELTSKNLYQLADAIDALQAKYEKLREKYDVAKYWLNHVGKSFGQCPCCGRHAICTDDCELAAILKEPQ